MNANGDPRPAPRGDEAAAPRAIAPQDAALIEAFLHGDQAAAAVIEGWVARICRLRAWRLRRHDDLVQDVLLELVKVLTAGRFAGRSSLQTFVERVAKYRCLDAVRRERKLRLVSWEDHGEPEPAIDDSPEERLATEEAIRLCRLVLDRLPAPCRVLLRQVLAEDRRYEDLAAEHGVALGTIKSRVARCRERASELRAHLLRTPAAWREGADR
jgi:RNA polymerase sigma factor (sigma-70 family)